MPPGGPGAFCVDIKIEVNAGAPEALGGPGATCVELKIELNAGGTLASGPWASCNELEMELNVRCPRASLEFQGAQRRAR